MYVSESIADVGVQYNYYCLNRTNFTNIADKILQNVNKCFTANPLLLNADKAQYMQYVLHWTKLCELSTSRRQRVMARFFFIFQSVPVKSGKCRMSAASIQQQRFSRFSIHNPQLVQSISDIAITVAVSSLSAKLQLVPVDS
jgi:hypothetical protein